MTPMQQIIIGLFMIVAWYTGWRMKKSEADTVIGYRKDEIKDLKKQIEITDKWTDTLFNGADMEKSYYQGRNDEYDVLQFEVGEDRVCEKAHPNETFRKWLDKTFTKPIN